jgi:hypothetical protein
MTLPCGTIERYRQHLYRGDEIDDACKRAHREYDRQYQGKPERKAKMMRQQKIRRTALVQLAAEFPERFDEIYRECEIRLMMEEIAEESDSE